MYSTNRSPVYGVQKDLHFRMRRRKMTYIIWFLVVVICVGVCIVFGTIIYKLEEIDKKVFGEDDVSET